MNLDQFYTSKSVAEECISLLSMVSTPPLILLEPSAGGGALIDAARRKWPDVNIEAYDIDPHRNDIIKVDFLSADIQYRQNVSVFANPPYGKRSDLAIRFFNRCAEVADTIGFIVPPSFRKWSVQSKLDRGFSLILDIIPTSDEYLVNGKVLHHRRIFQVWQRGARPDNMRIASSPPVSRPDFVMWQYNNTPQALKVFDNRFDFAVPRQGYQIYTRRETVSDMCEKTTQWILFKASNTVVLDKLMSIDFTELAIKNTSTPGFGKADVVEVYSSMST